MSEGQFAGLLGFAFAVAWIGFGFGQAILCLLAAGAFYAGIRFVRGELDVDELRGRVEGARAGMQRPRQAPGGRR